MNKQRKKPGPAPGTVYIKDEGDRLVNLTIRLPRRLADKLRKLGKPTRLVRDAVEDKYGS